MDSVISSTNSAQKTFYELEIERISEQHGLPEYQYIQVRQSRHFMQTNFPEKIELDSIAKAACMSRFHFVRLFQKVYGTSPRQYLRDIRINKARELLKNGVRVSQVCFEVGYDSLPTFIAAFKRGVGRSPGQYQRLQNSNRE